MIPSIYITRFIKMADSDKPKSELKSWIKQAPRSYWVIISVVLVLVILVTLMVGGGVVNAGQSWSDPRDWGLKLKSAAGSSANAASNAAANAP